MLSCLRSCAGIRMNEIDESYILFLFLILATGTSVISRLVWFWANGMMILDPSWLLYQEGLFLYLTGALLLVHTPITIYFMSSFVFSCHDGFIPLEGVCVDAWLGTGRVRWAYLHAFLESLGKNLQLWLIARCNIFFLVLLVPFGEYYYSGKWIFKVRKGLKRFLA